MAVLAHAEPEGVALQARAAYFLGRRAHRSLRAGEAQPQFAAMPRARGNRQAESECNSNEPACPRCACVSWLGPPARAGNVNLCLSANHKQPSWLEAFQARLS